MKKLLAFLAILWLYLILVYYNTYIFKFNDNGVVIRANTKTGTVDSFMVNKNTKWIRLPLREDQIPSSDKKQQPVDLFKKYDIDTSDVKKVVGE